MRSSNLPWIVVVATALGFAIVQLDVSIVNVALASISRNLGSGVAELQWVVDAYTVAFAALLLSAGELGDRFGARRALVGGFAVFGLASLGCALAPNMSILIAARCVQGAGAALLVPCSLAVLNHASAGRDQVRAGAVALWTAAGSIGLAAGPIAGGVLIASFGWRAIFFVNVPFALAGVWLAQRFLRETPSRRGSFDISGQVLAIIALASSTGVVISAGRIGWSSPVVLGGFALAVACGMLFVATETRARAPMLPLDFFKHVSFNVAVGAGIAINLTVYGAFFILSLYMQNVLGYTPLQTGFGFLVPSVVIGFANVLAGRFVATSGPWLPMIGGLSVAAVGFLWLVTLHTGSSYASMIPGLALFPFGVGMAVPAMTTVVLGSVERNRSGVASGVLNTVRQSAGAFGVALFGTLFASSKILGLHISFGLSALLVLLACAPATAIALGFPHRRKESRA